MKEQLLALFVVPERGSRDHLLSMEAQVVVHIVVCLKRIAKPSLFCVIDSCGTKYKTETKPRSRIIMTKVKILTLQKLVWLLI